MAITGDDLFDALHDCDGLAGSMEGNACASGVFMENLIVDGAHGGHYSKYLNPSEPLYPCTAVDKKYKPACLDRKSTRLNSSHTVISYAVFCLKKKERH